MAKPMKKSSFAGKVANNAEKTKASGSSYGYLNLPQGVGVFTPEPGGKAWLDFLPYKVTATNHPDRDNDSGIAVPGELWYKRPFKTHRNIGATNDAVVCLNSIGKRCPICEARAQLVKEGAAKEETDALKSSARNLYLVMVKNDKKFDEKKIHIWDVSQFLFQNLLTDELMEASENEVFPDLECGKTLKIRFDSRTMGKGKPFAEASRIDFEDRDPYPETLMAAIPSLDSVLNILTYEQLERKFLELEADDETTAPEPPKNTPPPRETSKAQRETAEPGEDTPPEQPSRRRAAPAAAPEEPPKVSRKPKGTPCVACEGVGKNSRGGECKICKGTGEKPQPEPEPKAAPKGDNPCPFDHVFGSDFEKFDHCDECKQWDACLEEKESK